MVSGLLTMRFPDALPADVDLKEHLRGLKADISLEIPDVGLKATSMENALTNERYVVMGCGPRA